MRDYLKALRLGRWPRSASILIGTGAYWALVMKFSVPKLDLVGKFLVAFLLTWAISTANYIINEITDAPYDVHYPDKANRPVASGKAKEDILMVLFLLLVASSLILSYLLFNRTFFLTLFSLLMAGIFYNVKPIRLKDKPFADSIFESINNPIRLTLGWTLITPKFPDLFLLFAWWAFGNFLMAGKRLSEINYLGENAGKYRKSLKFYTKRSLTIMMWVSAFTFLFFMWIFCWRHHLLFTSVGTLFSLPFFYKFYRDSTSKTMDEPERAIVKSSLLFSIGIFALILILGIFVDLRIR